MLACLCRQPPLPPSYRVLCAAALIEFCDMLRASDNIQQAFFQGMEDQYAAQNFKWRHMLMDARGRTHAEMICATTAVDSADLSNAAATFACQSAAEEDGETATAQPGERMPATQDEQAATVIDMCRHALDMSRQQLLGSSDENAKDRLDERVENSLLACKVEVLQSKTSYPITYNGREFQVCCMELSMQ